MGTMVSLSMVQVGVFAFLACLSAGIYVGLRSQSSLGWLASALCCGGLAALLVGQARGSLWEWLALTLLGPAAYLCLAQSVRALLGQRRQYWALIGTVLFLTAVALVLALIGVRFQYQTLSFQLACALAAAESVIRLTRARQKTLLDLCLMATLIALVITFVVRIPAYLILFPPGSGYSVIRGSSFQHMSLAISGFLGPTTAFLLLAKIVGSVIATYRTRSELDGLTGLLNRHAFDQAVVAGARRGAAIILCDIDHFKRVNDRYGHAVGDDVLREFAALLAQTGHCVGRMGGEEFALLLPGSSVADAAHVADMVRLRFHAASYSGIAPDHRLSASFGVADIRPGTAAKDAFIRADTALYQAKEAGRDRVVVAGDAPGAEGTQGLRAA
jgi:diguanylate cyclase (GGDEF)-like protein